MFSAWRMAAIACSRYRVFQRMIAVTRRLSARRLYLGAAAKVETLFKSQLQHACKLGGVAKMSGDKSPFMATALRAAWDEGRHS
jgi:hypothetical protein